MSASELLEEQIGPVLLNRGYQLVAAESCTGGLLSHRITNIPGSSEYFLGSVVSYAYEAKESLLGVRRETLVQFGAVSRETVLEMALGARRALAEFFDIEHLVGISISGIAGPGGGMPEKPVGLVWIGLSTPEGEWAWKFINNGSRIENKEFSAQKSLELLMGYLNGQLLPES